MTLAAKPGRQVAFVVVLMAHLALLMAGAAQDRRVLFHRHVTDATVQLELGGVKLVDEELFGLGK